MATRLQGGSLSATTDDIMLRNNPDQLYVHTTPVQMHSAPESRRNSLGEADKQRRRRVSEVSRTLAPRTSSFPDCSAPACSLQETHSAKAASDRSPAKTSKTKSPKQEARRTFQNRLMSSPRTFSLNSFYSAPSSSSSSRPQACQKLSLSLLRHHNSVDSAALACEFFGHDSSEASLCCGEDEEANSKAEQSTSKVNVTMSPLLRRPTMEDSISQSCVMPSPTTCQLRRLTISLPGSLPVSPQKSRRHQLRTPSLESFTSGEPPSPSSYFRVVVLGEEGVGKSTLIRQMSVQNRSCELTEGGTGTEEVEEEDDTGRVVVSIDRNEEHCTLEIFDNPLEANIDTLRPDAVIVVYSVSDRKSYITAKEVTRHLRCELGVDRPVFLVGNKTDLRRRQHIAIKEAKEVAETYDCCVIETSAALRMNVDMLLLKVLDRILDQLRPLEDTVLRAPGQSRLHSSSPARAMRFFSRLLRHALLKRSLDTEAIAV